MRMISRLLPVLALAGLCAAAAPAKADTFLTLQGVTFDDGGTASGFITLNPYGNVDTYEITTTAGTFLGGATYLTGTPITSPGPAIFGGGTEIVVYDGGYPEALGLVGPDPLPRDRPRAIGGVRHLRLYRRYWHRSLYHRG